MGQDLQDIPVTVLPDYMIKELNRAAASGYCQLTDENGKPTGKMMSAYKFLSTISKDPEKYGAAWKLALEDVGTAAVGTTVGAGALSIAAGPAAPLVLLGALIAMPALGSPRVATIIVVNNTDDDLVVEHVYQDHGVQTGRPTYSIMDPDSGSVLSTHQNTIPGRVKFGSEHSMSGVGMLRFEKDLDAGFGVYGTEGAVSFRFKDPKMTHHMAVGWKVPQSGHPSFAATDDIGHYTSLEDFWSKTIDDGKGGAGQQNGSVLLAGYEISDKNKDKVMSWIEKAAKAIGTTVPHATAAQQAAVDARLAKTPTVLMNWNEREYPDHSSDGDDIVYVVSIWNHYPQKDEFA